MTVASIWRAELVREPKDDEDDGDIVRMEFILTEEDNPYDNEESDAEFWVNGELTDECYITEEEEKKLREDAMPVEGLQMHCGKYRVDYD